ncbi:MAG TPA: porin [Aliidongia sp.]|nr:porin [Aliidongia sp.]
MKKLLLGTSALVAAGLFSTGASAQTATTDTPVQFKIGGQYYAGAAAMVEQDDNPGQSAYKRNPLSVQEYFLIRFIGSTTFSNGITAGVWTRLNAFSAPNATANTTSGFQSSNNTTIKDSYLYLKNAASWGEFRLGDDSDVRRNVATGNNAGAANGDGNLGANSAALQWLNSPVYNFTTLNLDGRGTKAVYYSPTIAGFQFGASFAPDRAGGHTNGPGNIGDNSGLTDRITNGLTPSYLNNQTAYDYWSLSGQWTGTIGPVKLIGTVGYSTGSRKCAVSSGVTIALGQNATQAQCSLASTANADPHVYNGGFQVDYGPWEFGADYEQSVGIPGGLVGGANGIVSTFSNQIINKQADMNLSYTIGAIRIGAEYSRGEFEGVTGDANVKRAAINNEIQVGATYTVGPGVALVGMIQQESYDANGKYVPLTGSSFSSAATGVAANNNVYAKGYDSTAIIFETSIRF